MKVLHVIPSVSTRSGGPAQAIGSMCRALIENGVEIVIATTDHEVNISSFEFAVSGANGNAIKQTKNSQLETRNYKGVPTIFFPLQRGESFKYSRPFADWLDANVTAFDVVHIHAVFNHACIAAARACRKHNVPYVVRPLGTLDPWSMKQKPLRKFLFWQLCGKRLLQGAAAVHYTALAEKSRAEKSLRLNHGRVIPLGVEVEQAPLNSDEIVQRKLSALAGRSFVLVLSRLHPKKGLDVFIDAFISLVKQEDFGEWRLVLAGEGSDEYVQALKKKVADHGAEDVVLFPGWLEGDEKNAFLARASLLALPSYQENFGVCLIESLAAGVPVLVSPHVDLAREIDSAGAGWIIPVETSAIKKGLIAALGSPAERAKRGQAGKNLSREYSTAKVAQHLGDLYSAVSASH